MRSKPKRPKSNAGSPGGGPAPLQASAPVSVGRCVSGVNSDDDLVLIDKFGHLHARRILRTWPERVLQAMGVRFID